MVHVLEDWDVRCIEALGEIEGQIAEVRRRAVKARRREIENQKAVEQAMGDEHEFAGKAPGKRGAGDKDDGDGDGKGEAGDEMEVDEESGRGRPRGAKRGGGRLTGFAKKLGG